MLIVERIVHKPAGFAILDQAEMPQEAQLMRHRGHGHFQQRGEIAHAQFRARERGDDPHARWVAQRGENLRRARDAGRRGHLFGDACDRRFVDVENLAGILWHGGSPL